MKMLKILVASAAVTLAGVASLAQAEAPTTVSGLVGTWNNVNPNSGSIVKIEVTQTGSQLNFKSYGACTPTPCVHSTVVAYPFSASVTSNTATGFTAFRNDTFKTTRFDATRENSFGGTLLRLNSFSTFAAGDTRKDYTTTELFVRQ